MNTEPAQQNFDDSQDIVLEAKTTLVRAMSLYPYGVPVRYVTSTTSGSKNEESQAVQEPAYQLFGQENAKLLIIAGYICAKQPFASAEGQLLKSIIENGLKLESDQVLVLVYDPSNSQFSVDNLLSSCNTNVKCIVFGQRLSCFQKLQEEFGSERVLATFSLTEINSQPDKKRLAWEQIKKFKLN